MRRDSSFCAKSVRYNIFYERRPIAGHGNTQLLLYMVVQTTQEWRKLLQYYSNIENSYW